MDFCVPERGSSYRRKKKKLTAIYVCRPYTYYPQKYIQGRHMYEQVKLRKKRWNNKEMLLQINM